MAHFSREVLMAIERAEGAMWARALPRIIQSGAVSAAALPCAGGWALHLGAGSPLAYAIGVGVGEPADEEALAAAERFYHERAADAAFEVSPLADPAIYRFLAERGYRPSFFLNVVAHSLEARDGDSGDVTVREVTNERELEIWENAVASGFTEPQSADWIATAIRHNGIAADHRFLAYIGSEPAGGGALAIVDGVAVLFGASTLPKFRRRGVQSALVRARIDLARGRGCRAACSKMLVASTSQQTMERLGFRVLFSRIRMSRPRMVSSPHEGTGEP